MYSSDHHSGDIIVLQTDIEATFHRGNQTPQSVTAFKDTAEVKSYLNTPLYAYTCSIFINKIKEKQYSFKAVEFC